MANNHRKGRDVGMMAGIVEGLYVTPSKGEVMTAVASAEAVAMRGLVGDRYYLGTGYYSGKPGWGANVTLIASEAIAAINAGHQSDFDGKSLRRNILTSNVNLGSLIGQEFRCGSAVLRGPKPFPPCAHLAYLLGRPDVLKFFAYCGGIGAEVLVDGTIRLQDTIMLLDTASVAGS